jgi:hypothetical protein
LLVDLTRWLWGDGVHGSFSNVIMGRFAYPRVIVSGWFDYEVHHLGSVHYTKRRRERINSFNIHSLSFRVPLPIFLPHNLVANL